MKSFISSLALLGIISSSCSESDSSGLKERWNQKNRPEIMAERFRYDHEFANLPLEGTLAPKPWSGDYWPTYKGGITYRWMLEEGSYWTDEALYSYDYHNPASLANADLSSLSPAEKYDLFREDLSFSLTDYERRRTRIMKTVKTSKDYDENFEIPAWEGLCHAWAPATIAYRSPKPVTLKSRTGAYEIPFGASDVKALLTYFLHIYNGNRTYFLGERCNTEFAKLDEQVRSGEITEEQRNRSMEAIQCRDVNAGSFHIVLANQISNKNESFIVDVTRDFEVWNQAVEGYRSTILSESEEVYSDAARNTTKIVEVVTEMDYTTEISYSVENTDDVDSTATKTYRYFLELDAAGKIIGGKWISSNRPDFLWKQEIPEFQGFFQELKSIYEASIAQ
ncbi:hypothetical protein [Pseudobacteriovorax antillogorgiicola]|uniref:Transglutaminase elicitor n=1 Tax=Pseudobacteriovorax antillogorgiicola TaxID=1513793 RepID=A0A1Y6CL18_9BACT|nr:hypothetical protein [Pseudobacteriovorax antillogorgiicola]TCS45928.1 transglutaminase elicitor [Pseudobacteriovorax antillogorgiicola]SMF71010.1 Transglutaminase elicitor [Pseudobacteriovorax antillogorgiicola]